MRLTKDSRWDKKEFNIESAVGNLCQRDNSAPEDVALAYAQDAAAELIGRLITRLHAKGIMDDEDVLAVLQSFSAA